jgi:GTP-binding protein Era
MSEEPVHRAGVVALLGPPNVGKSTLLNRLLGEKLAIVTAKPQTTRSRILGIFNVPGAQILLLDTPGLHESTKPLNVALNDAVEEAARDCDVALLLVDLTRGWLAIHDTLFDGLRERGAPVFLVGTKSDLSGPDGGVWPLPQAGDAAGARRISAKRDIGIDGLVREIVAHLPESPALYPGEELTDRSVRWLAAELVREALFEELGQELPYSMAVEVVEFDESRADLVRIRANLLVERDSQKRIVVGRNGEMVKRIGSKARRQIEKLLDSKVYLELFVKLDPKWLKNPKRIESLGYH